MGEVRPMRRTPADSDTESAFEVLLYTEAACRALIDLIREGKTQAEYVGPQDRPDERLNIYQYEFYGPQNLEAEHAHAR
jgi:hypothetical protein